MHYYLPVEGIPSEDRFAVLRSDSLIVIMRPQSYNGAYSELNSRFFPVLIKIKNTGNSRMKLNSNNFSIIAEGTQYDPVPLEFLLANLRDSMLLKSYSDPFATTETSISTLNENKAQELYYEVINSAFSFGDLLPGGMKEGYLFYSRNIFASSSWTIDVLGQSVGFEKK